MPYKDQNKQREYQRSWIQQRRDCFLMEKKCELCGSTENLNLHHRNPKEKISHSFWSWSSDRMKKELAKCDILCISCHQKIHHPRNVTHGCITMYKRYQCRCEECRTANRDYVRRRRTGLTSIRSVVGVSG